MQIRTPAVAGMFYPGEKNKLTKLIDDCYLHPFGPGNKPPAKSERKIFGVIVPHAGFVFIGHGDCGFIAGSTDDIGCGLGRISCLDIDWIGHSISPCYLRSRLNINPLPYFAPISTCQF